MNTLTSSEIGAAACARCATVQKTCCQRAEILVTAADIDRIADHTATATFFEDRIPNDPSYLEPDPDDPEWLPLTVRADGTRRVLRRRADGDCTFLGARGCALPVDVRPLVCRLYPYAYSATRIVGSDSEYCPTAMLSPQGAPMTSILGIDSSIAEAWRHQLYEELRDGPA